jgi:hypothetical protein
LCGHIAASALVLLVVDDLDVGAIDAPLAFARAEASELVTRDQVAVASVSGGQDNFASGIGASISGGLKNSANGSDSSII